MISSTLVIVSCITTVVVVVVRVTMMITMNTVVDHVTGFISPLILFTIRSWLKWCSLRRKAG